ncbi:Arf-GAP with Rho-GAP domain [Mactra antiquata]
METANEEVDEDIHVVCRRERRNSSRLSRPLAVVDVYFDDSDCEDVNNVSFDEVEEQNDEIDTSDSTLPLSPTSPRKDFCKEGYLSKKGGKNNDRGWRKRWFTFDEKVLKYFPTRKSCVSLRIIPVAQMVTVTPINSTRPQSRSSVPDIFGVSAHQHQFSLQCKQRTFIIGTDSLDNCQKWQSSLMAGIINYQKTETDSNNTGGEMNNPDISGSVRFDKNKKKYFVALKGGILRYYYNKEDYAINSPIHELNVSVIRVIEIDKLSLQIDSPPSQRFVLHFDVTSDRDFWKTRLENAIAEVLGDDEVYDVVKLTEGNDKCADCGTKDPKWASINLGIVICIKCAGPHRSLGAHRSKVRSLRMDNIFRKNNDVVQLLSEIGNKKSNTYWLQCNDDNTAIDEDSTDTVRHKYIVDKYRHKTYVEDTTSTTDELNKELLRAVHNQDIMKTMEAVFSGADVNYRSKDLDQTVIEIADRTDNITLKLFLEFNINTDLRKCSADTTHSNEVSDKSKKLSVYYEGHLEKTGPNLKGYLKRCCVLHNGTITYYATKNKQIEKGSIDLSNATSIATVTGQRAYSFDIGTSCKGRVYRFAAQDRESQQNWMVLLSKVIGPEDIEIPDDIMVAGIFYCKFYNTTDWVKVWLMLYDKILRLQSLRNLDKIEEVYLTQQTQCFQCNVGKHVESNNATVMATNQRIEIVPADMTSITSIQGIVIKDTKKLYTLIQQLVS